MGTTLFMSGIMKNYRGSQGLLGGLLERYNEEEFLLVM